MVERKISPDQISIEDKLFENAPQDMVVEDTREDLVEKKPIIEDEEFLIEDDFKRIGEDITVSEIAKINHRPMNEEEKLIDEKENFNLEKEWSKDISKKTEKDIKKHKEKSPWTSLLDQIPIEDRRYINPQTLIQRNDEYGRFRRGFAESTAIARRVLNEKGKPVMKGSLIEYTALSELRFGYEPKNSTQNWIHFIVRPGENFFAPRCGENKEKRKKLLRDK